MLKAKLDLKKKTIEKKLNSFLLSYNPFTPFPFVNIGN